MLLPALLANWAVTTGWAHEAPDVAASEPENIKADAEIVEAELDESEVGLEEVEADEDNSDKSETAAVEATTKRETELNDVPQAERNRMKMILLVTIVMLLSFVIAIALMAIIRMGRWNRKRIGLGNKHPPTEHFDAWSNYRLDEDDYKDNKE